MKQRFGASLLLVLIGCSNGRSFGPVALRDLPRKWLGVLADNDGGALIYVGYDTESKCGTLLAAEATLNGVALTWESRGWKGPTDPETGGYGCYHPVLSLLRGIRVPPNAEGKALLIVSDRTESLSLESSDWWAAVSATLRPVQPPIHQHDQLTVDFAPSGDEFKPGGPRLDFFDAHQSQIGNSYYRSLIDSPTGWTATFDVPVAGMVRLVASWRRAPSISACVGAEFCTAATDSGVDLGSLQIE